MGSLARAAIYHGDEVGGNDQSVLTTFGAFLGSRGNVRGWKHTLLAKYLD